MYFGYALFDFFPFNRTVWSHITPLDFSGFTERTLVKLKLSLALVQWFGSFSYKISCAC